MTRFVIQVKKEDGSGGNLIFEDRDKASGTFRVLEEKLQGTSTVLKKGIIK